MERLYVLMMATVADADEVSRHRGFMFLDMRLVDDADAEKLIVASAPWFIDVMERDQYKGWIVEQNARTVAGGSLHLSKIGPLPEPQTADRRALGTCSSLERLIHLVTGRRLVLSWQQQALALVQHLRKRIGDYALVEIITAKDGVCRLTTVSCMPQWTALEMRI